jgi:2-polyprenyl-3-methyl-5-hydroxy-6-metoxy-1,4-benzoquinol methylase
LARNPLSPPTGEDLIDRYRSVYRIPAETPVTEQMVRHHWELEQRLTGELRGSTPENRWAVFEHCYTTLYTELPWLNESDPDDNEIALEYADWPHYLGPPPMDIYEVGAGSGALARFLSAKGYRCRASEITRERGHWDERSANPSWGQTDGVHLTQFEQPESYDAVISNQVVEHLHPDDLPEHLHTACALLRPGGRYVLSTPHAHLGPADVSAVFRTRRPQGMHLQEYTYAALYRALRAAGFTSVSAVFKPRGRESIPRPSRRYLTYLRTVEVLLGLVPSQLLRRTVGRRILRPPLFSPGVTLIAQRERSHKSDGG